MANAVVTLLARNKMLRARAGEIILPPIKGMAIGDGGVDNLGEPIPPDESSNSLNNELIRKPIDGYTFITDQKCRYMCTLGDLELAGKYISEVALYDTEGDLVAIKTFKKKGKDSDLEMTFNIDDVF